MNDQSLNINQYFYQTISKLTLITQSVIANTLLIFKSIYIDFKVKNKNQYTR